MKVTFASILLVVGSAIAAPAAAVDCGICTCVNAGTHWESTCPWWDPDTNSCKVTESNEL